VDQKNNKNIEGENSSNESEEIDKIFDSLTDKVSGKFSNFLINSLIKWLIRTSIGLIGFGILWHYYGWDFWVFWSYVFMATLSLIFTMFIFLKMLGLFSSNTGDLDEEADDLLKKLAPLLSVRELWEWWEKRLVGK